MFAPYDDIPTQQSVALSSSLKISREARHMLLNVNAHILMVVVTFSVGVLRVGHQVRSLHVCLEKFAHSLHFWLSPFTSISRRTALACRRLAASS